MKPILICAALALVATSLGAADVQCPKENVVGGGIDRSLPCVFHSPLPYTDSKVMFGRGSDHLDDKAKAVLDRQAEILRRTPNLAITVWGHVDHEEATAPTGQALGFKRASAVRDYLALQGVSSDRITTNSRGDRAMIVKDRSEEGLAVMRYASTEAEE